MYCSKCGNKLDNEAVVCPECGVPTQNFTKRDEPNIIINNTNTNVNTNVNKNFQTANSKNKWFAFFLCLFFGYLGAHKFYERKFMLGVIYLFTAGFFCIGWFVDIFALFFKPNPYYV